MSLIKCVECGEEISEKLKCCSNCGYPLKNNTRNINKNIRMGIAFILLGVFAIIWGLNLDYLGVSSISQSYGGDAYTGIQNAASKTANNINALGDTLCSGLKGIMITFGGTIILYGVSVMKKEKN